MLASWPKAPFGGKHVQTSVARLGGKACTLRKKNHSMRTRCRCSHKKARSRATYLGGCQPGRQAVLRGCWMRSTQPVGIYYCIMDSHVTGLMPRFDQITKRLCCTVDTVAKETPQQSTSTSPTHNGDPPVSYCKGFTHRLPPACRPRLRLP